MCIQELKFVLYIIFVSIENRLIHYQLVQQALPWVSLLIGRSPKRDFVTKKRDWNVFGSYETKGIFIFPFLGAGDCVILLDDSSSYPAYPPIITDENDLYVFPEGTYFADDRSITTKDGDTIKLSCRGTQFASLTGDEFVKAK